MGTNTTPPFTSTNNSLFATLAAIESGTGGGYSLDAKGVLGAYSMGYSALSAIHAVTGGTPGQPSTYVWNTAAGFGSSTDEFLANPNLQNAAALAYMNNVVLPAMPASVTNGTLIVNGQPVTVDGYLLAGWEQPNNALGVVDLSNRLQSGALTQAAQGFPGAIGLPVNSDPNGTGLPPGSTAALSNNNTTLTITTPSGAQMVYSVPNAGSTTATVTIGSTTLTVNATAVQSVVGVNGNGQPTLQIGTSFDADGNILSVAQISPLNSNGTGFVIKNGSSSQLPDTVTVQAGSNAQISLNNLADGVNPITATVPNPSGGGTLFKVTVDDDGVSVAGSNGAPMYSSSGAQDSVKVSAGQIAIDGGSNPAGIGSTRGEVITSAGTQVFDGSGNLVKTIPSNVNVQEDENGFLSYPDPTDGTKTDLISPTGTLGSKTAMLLDDEGNPVGSLANLENVESIAGALPNGPGQGGEGDNGLYDALKVASKGDDGSPTNVTAWQNAAGETTSLSFTSSTTGAVYQLSYNPQSASGAAVKVSPADSNGVQTLSSWSVDDNGNVTAGPSMQINGTVDTGTLQPGQPVAVSTPAGTYHIDAATGDITDSGAVTTPPINGQTVTLLGLNGSSPFALASSGGTITAGALTSNAAGSYSDASGNSYFVQNNQVLTTVSKNSDGSYTIDSPLSSNSWTISGANGPVSIGDGGVVQIPTANGPVTLNPVTQVLSAVDADGNPTGGATSQLQISGSGTNPSLQIGGTDGSALANFDPSLAPIDINALLDGVTSFAQTTSQTNSSGNTDTKTTTVATGLQPTSSTGQGSAVESVTQSQTLDSGTANAVTTSETTDYNASRANVGQTSSVTADGLTLASGFASLTGQLYNLLGGKDPLLGVAASALSQTLSEQASWAAKTLVQQNDITTNWNNFQALTPEEQTAYIQKAGSAPPEPDQGFLGDYVGSFATAAATFEIDNAIASLGLGQTGTAAVDALINTVVQIGAKKAISEIGTQSIGTVLSDSATAVENALGKASTWEGAGINFVVGQALDAVFGSHPNAQEAQIGQAIGTAVATVAAAEGVFDGVLAASSLAGPIGIAIGSILGAVIGSAFGPDNPPVGFNADQQITWMPGGNTTVSNANGYFATAGFAQDDTKGVSQSEINQVDTAVKNMGQSAVLELNQVFQSIATGASGTTNFSGVPLDIKFGYALGSDNAQGNKSITAGTPNWFDSLGTDSEDDQEFNVADGYRQSTPEDALQQGVYRVLAATQVSNGDSLAERVIAEDRANNVSIDQLNNDLTALAAYEANADLNATQLSRVYQLGLTQPAVPVSTVIGSGAQLDASIGQMFQNYQTQLGSVYSQLNHLYDNLPLDSDGQPEVEAGTWSRAA